MNRIQLIGHLGRDPEVVTGPHGLIVSFSVATNENWTDRQSGERMTHTEWHEVVCFDRVAQIAADYLKKGSEVFLEGRRRTRRWTGKDGIERTDYEVRVEEMRMLGPARSEVLKRLPLNLAVLEQMTKQIASGARTDMTISDLASVLGTLRQALGAPELPVDDRH
mgnify:CR=1 FL=1